MTDSNGAKAGYWPLILMAGVALMSLAIAIWLVLTGGSDAAPTAQAAAADRTAAVARVNPDQRAAMEAIVHDYIIAHPEVIAQAAATLQARESTSRLGAVRSRLETPFPGATLGNPDGAITVVAFSDYACGYCRASVADVRRLIAGNRNVGVVMRELPILSDDSVTAARWALAAARQGRYAAFHTAMFAGGRPNADSIAAAARKAGLDMDAARTFAASGAANAEIKSNLALAQALGISGTPSWVVGPKLLEGAVGFDALNAAVKAQQER